MKKCEICKSKKGDNYYVNSHNVIMWVCDDCLETELKDKED